ncbi:MAG: type II CRISPR-associated endonuclease Cas1 [Pseudarcicella sp.]|nr:type II CRISPR-associated endonuclease Cas1 [Pseudarcicella sp.]MBP6411283.1 type II CRISPR-associated endonuclease Cas1 [Pseudarcicella sp.]
MIKRTLYFGNPAYLSLQNHQMIIKLPEVETNLGLPDILKKEAQVSIPVEDIGLVVIDHQRITITQGLMAKLFANNTVMIWCDENHLPTGISTALVGNDTFTEKVNHQLNASEPLRKQLWKQTIEAKISNQAKVMELLGCNGMVLRHLSENVNSGDPENKEGRAAARYWEALLGPYQVNRGQHEAPPNNFFNYGYAILRAIIARSLIGSGCLPSIGIHHHNKYNAYCLADDIMEPYRPVVDLHIFQYLQTLSHLPEVLTKEHKQEMLKIPQLDITIDGKQSPLMVGCQRTTASLAKCYAGESRKLLYPTIN